MDDVELRELLSTIDPKGGDVLRRSMRTEQFEACSIAQSGCERRADRESRRFR